MANFLEALNSVIWSPVLVFLCLGAGIYFTVVTRGLQVRCIPDMLKQIPTERNQWMVYLPSNP